MNRPIRTLKQLKDISSDKALKCFIALESGTLSSKTISYDPDEDLWWVFNHIDDSELNDISTEELSLQTNITKAISVGRLYTYGD